MYNFTKDFTQARADALLKDSVLLEINTMLICEVLQFYPDTQTVDVQPVITAKIVNDNGVEIISRLGEPVKVSEVLLPPLKGVPICYPRAGNFMITLPIAVGDTGMLIISSRDISAWKELGGQQAAGLDLFNINDGVYLPYVAAKTTAISDYSANALEIRAGNDKISMAADGRVVINGIDFMTHTHPAQGSLKDGNSLPCSGSTGGPQ